MSQQDRLTGRIIGCAYNVYNRMGFGFLEVVYEKCMLLELAKAGLHAKNQEPITVYYGDHVVGEFVADLVVESSLIVELKSVRTIAVAHEVQLVNYLAATSMNCGLLLNFGARGVEVRRKNRAIRHDGGVF